ADHRVVCRAGDVVVALAQNEGCARDDGPEYNQVYVHIFRVLDGQVRSLVEVFDTALADRALWGDVADLAPDEPFSLAGLAAQGF
ncbi:MAG: nuclear transport factor 2 family protein, partial [Luminiphilus sp.]